MRCERVNMYISIYQDIDAVNPAKMGAEVSVNSTVEGNYQTRMEWSGKQFSMPIFAPNAEEDTYNNQKSELRRR